MKIQNSGGPLIQAMGDRKQKIEMVNKQYEPRLKRATETVERTSEQVTAMEQLKRLIQGYTTNAGAMSSQVINPFISNTVKMTTPEASGIATNYVNVTLGDGAQQGTFNVGVNSVATSSRLIIQGNALPLAENPVIDGTLTITVGGVPNVINVITNDTVDNIVTNINTQFTNNNVEAQAFAIKTPNGSYIEIRHEQTGDNVMTMNWVDGGVNTELTQLSNTTGQVATITVEGIPITQDSNTFIDVLPGVTITAISPNTSPGAILNTQTVNVVNDPTSALSPLVNLLNSYNRLKVFVSQMTERQGDGYADTAVLHNSDTINQAQNLLDNFSTGVNAGGGLYKSLSDIGIGLGIDPDPREESNKLGIQTLQVLDKNKLTDAITNHFTDFTNLFRGTSAFVPNVANPGGTVLGFGSFTSVLPNNVLNVAIPVSIALNNDGNGNPVVNNITATIGGNAYNGSYANGTITFPNTPLAGLSLSYTNLGYYNNSFGVENFTMTLTQGLTDVAYNSSNSLVSSDGGSGSIIFTQQTLTDALKAQTTEQKKIEGIITKKIAEVDAAFDKISIMDTYNNFMMDMLSELFSTHDSR